jgi:hypothetical protein
LRPISGSGTLIDELRVEADTAVHRIISGCAGRRVPFDHW